MPPKADPVEELDHKDDDDHSINTHHFLGHDDPNAPKGTCGRAIVFEFKRTVGTWWCKEMTNFNQKTIAVSFFIYFAAVAPAITFGAVYGKATNDQIGAVEMLIATAWCGILYALIGGQPIMINGGTGPVLAFSTVLFDIAGQMDVNFLTLNAWTGLWVAGFMFVAAFFDLNRFMKHATRFTDEIFALLIASIFVVDALGSPFSPTGIYHYFKAGHKSHDEFDGDEDYNYTATAFLAAILTIGTTWMAFFFRGFKFSPFLPSDMWRGLFTDFAVVLSILFWCIIANVVFADVEVERLNVPDSITPTQICCTSDCLTSYPQDCPDIEPFGRRDWLVDLFALNGKAWVPFFAAIPAMLAFILVFLDDGITWHLLNHPSHKLSHGEAYNWDTILIGAMIAVNSMLGLPWLVAATVRSLTHLNSLAEKNDQGKIISVQETRLTHLGIHTLVLASLFALDVLKLIPVPVLYGVFLFMGLASLGTNEFFQRILMFAMQPSKFPKVSHTEHVGVKRMHIFTLIQLACFCMLLVFRSVSVIAIAFPIIIKLCIPIRMYLLPRYFTDEELIMLDTDDATVAEYLEYKEAKQGNVLTMVPEDAETGESGDKKPELEHRDTAYYASTDRDGRNLDFSDTVQGA